MNNCSHWFVLVQVIFITVTTVHSCMGKNSITTKKTGSDMGTLAEFLLQGYDKTVRPNYTSPTDVTMDLYIESFGKIEEVHMEFSLFMYLRQYWRDERLAGLLNATVVLEHEQIAGLWTPKPYCANAKNSDLMLPDKDIHSVLRVSTDGSIFYSRSTSIVASCYMDLRMFPLDTQMCHLSCGSYAYNDSEIKYRWKADFINVAKREMAQFTVGNVSLTAKVHVFTSGNFTLLKATFPFQRNLGYYIIQVYVPCFFLVLLSWIVFWMNPGDGSSRLTVGVTTILTIVFLLGYTNSMLPKVSYVKGIDWYVMAAFLFIFLSLLECIIVDKMWRMADESLSTESQENTTLHNMSKDPNNQREPRNGRLSPGVLMYRTNKSNKQDAMTDELRLTTVEKGESNRPSAQRPSSREAWGKSHKKQRCAPPAIAWCVLRCRNLPVRVDRCSRLLFPICFVIFNMGYWFALSMA